ncbi:hypothetical protein HZR21_10105 [Lactococcus laudensis]|uniref:Uncharacterized protein n=1 Tax=Pseudolactococcus laudensis TaxID=1494461 RepID=A0A7V8N2H1_9LACT|nr:hypothetical protein [Lactococcus laudensis]MBA0017449.1 hypothetical protein [Lactococcus laudensis]
MTNILNAVALLILIGAGIGALKAFAKGDKTNALMTGLIGLTVSSILSPTTFEAWKVVISSVISGVGKVIDGISGSL